MTNCTTYAPMGIRLGTSGIMLLFCSVLIASLVGCRAPAGATSTSAAKEMEKADIGKAEVGKVVSSEDWEIEIIGPAEKVKVVGEGDITYQAEGIYVVVPVRVTNRAADMRLFPKSLLGLEDDRSRRFAPTSSSIQVAYALPRHIELLLDSPIAANGTRQSIIMFDVPDDATGLKLTIAGVEETIDLGF